MSELHAPTLYSLAKFLDAVELFECAPKAEPTFLWLIHNDPRAQAMWEDLHRDGDDRRALQPGRHGAAIVRPAWPPPTRSGRRLR